ncbi:hypothetical protein VIBNIAM115_590021 [Vibrio nigripulchritudo AM115]|nr:hypothetical protein VIBNIAM115_590021 [Vibrio nigripulchritudo AM115]
MVMSRFFLFCVPDPNLENLVLGIEPHILFVTPLILPELLL